jgi:calcium permeable stress-gated cation channel
VRNSCHLYSRDFLTIFSLAIGLQYGWKSFAWVAGIPPLIIVILFKVYINRVFARPFRYYVPTEAELRNAQVHSQRGDVKGNRLEKRFGHPALHAKLFTPMLHANMMPLLAQVYSGRLDTEQTKLGEYGEQQADARVLPGGIRIAGIDQNDLEYDPILYQRDRGELDWDQRSIATALDSTTGFPAGGRHSPAPSLTKYNRYLEHGPRGGSEIELARIDLDQQPLLPPMLLPGQSSSSHSLPLPPGYTSPQPPYAAPGTTQYPPRPTYYGQTPSNDGYREAPTHRPYSRHETSVHSFHSGRDSPGLAGAGAYRR